MAPVAETVGLTLDLAETSLREVNRALRTAAPGVPVTVAHPAGAHALACGLDAPVDVTLDGHVGYYCAGMNQQATVTVAGNAGVGVAENMMSGRVHVTGDASQSAGATAHGGLLVIDGNAGARCGISMARIYVRGSVASLGADCVAEPMLAEHHAELAELLAAAGFEYDTAEFTRYGSARQLYHFHVDNVY